jgi:hypothetical protein
MMTTTRGFGRTGNYFISMRNAMQRAHACKTTLVLPSEDEEGHVLLPHQTTRLLDFAARVGEPHPDCGDPAIGVGLSGGSRAFWELRALQNTTPEHATFFRSYRPELGALGTCLRWYAGACNATYCAGLEHLKDALVAHIRQGDVYPSNHSYAFSYYGQPPLAYYLAALNFSAWSEMIVVAEPTTTNISPMWAGLRLLNQTGALKTPVTFQSSSDWAQDFRTLVCAHNVVESKSTFNEVLRAVGRATQIFSWQCLFSAFAEQPSSYGLYEIRVPADYKPFQHHDNSPRQWVDALLQNTSTPQLCDASTSKNATFLMEVHV